jgi:hypothetical protein
MPIRRDAPPKARSPREPTQNHLAGLLPVRHSLPSPGDPSGLPVRLVQCRFSELESEYGTETFGAGRRQQRRNQRLPDRVEFRTGWNSENADSLGLSRLRRSPSGSGQLHPDHRGQTTAAASTSNVWRSRRQEVKPRSKHRTESGLYE